MISKQLAENCLPVEFNGKAQVSNTATSIPLNEDVFAF